MELLFGKFTAAAHRHSLLKRFAQLSRVSVAALRVLGTLVASLVGFLASSAKISDPTEGTANAACGGIFNHRTDKFDDGTDPAGWYEDD